MPRVLPSSALRIAPIRDGAGVVTDFRVLAVAPEVAAALHQPVEAFVDATLRGLLPPESRDSFLFALGAALSDGSTHTAEYPILSSDRDARWTAESVVPEEGGTLLVVVRILPDSEERPPTPAATPVQRDDRYRAALHAADLTVWEFDPLSGTMSVSPGHRTLFDLPPTAELPTTLAALEATIHPEDRVWIARELRRDTEHTVIGQRPFEVQYRVVTATGEIRWMRTRGGHWRASAADPWRVHTVTRDVTDEVATAVKLAESEERFRSSFEDSAVGMALLAPDGSTLRVNKALTAMLGYSPEEGVKTQWSQLLHPDEVREAGGNLRKIGTGELLSTQTERRCVGRDGTIFWAQLTTSGVRDATGHTVNMIVQVEDISEQRRLEEALREGAERLRLSLAASDAAAYGWVSATGELWWSEGGLELLGFPAGGNPQTPKELWRHILPPDVQVMVQSLIQAGRSGAAKTDFSHRFRVRTPDGTIAWRESRGLHRCFPGGRREVQAIVRDISKDVAAETGRREVEERLAMVLAATREGVWDYNLVTRTNYYAPRWWEILGRRAQESREGDDPFRDLVHPEDYERVLAAGAAHREHPTTEMFDETFRMRHADGHWVWVRSRGRAVARDAAGRALRMVGTHADVSSERAMEEQMRQSQKMEAIGKLAGGIAHDFNNLLTAIGATASLVLEDLPGTSPHQEHLQEIALAADRAKSLTRQLLNFSRQEVEQAGDVLVDSVVEKITPLLRRLLGPAQTLTATLSAPKVVLRLDPANLELALLNLVANARDAMPHGGTITIATATTDAPANGATGQDGFVAITVRDTGVGMTPEIQERIFEPFFTTKPQGEGTGLGMPTVYSFVRRLGGLVQVESTVGSGTTVRLLLPISAHVQREHAERTTTGETAVVKLVQRVLVVDDDDLVRRSTVRLLERRGIQVVGVNGADEALATLDAVTDTPFDVILSDHAMPGRTGHELLEEVRRRFPGQRVVLMSGFADDGKLRQTFGNQEIPFLAKPFTLQELLGVLSE